MALRRHAQRINEFKARDIDYWLEFYKDGQYVNKVRMTDASADSLHAAIAEFEREHEVSSWKDLADGYKQTKFDAG